MSKKTQRPKTNQEVPPVLTSAEYHELFNSHTKSAKANKYKAKVDHVTDPETGKLIKFHSRREANFYRAQLNAMEYGTSPDFRPIKIERQVPFPLIVNGHKVGSYRLDFRITYQSGRVRHVDSKGYQDPTSTNTQLYKLKMALVKALYGVEVELA